MEPNPGSRTDPRPIGVPVDAVAPGIERRNDYGAYHLVETRVEDPTSGQFFDRCLALPQVRGTSRNDVSRRLDPEEIVFLDTETTGLDRGTGTHVFLVGVGYFESGSFTVRQHFIRDLHEEASLLHDLREFLGEFPTMLTFNGRAFDWPLLYNRFILHGYRDLPEFDHWDLLQSSRRVWRYRLRDCSLGNLERRVLGIERFGDVPGYLIPQLYFDYLRTRDATPLRPVFSHNQEDIVSLARLADRLLAAQLDPLRSLDHPVDRLCFGLHLLANDSPEIGAALIRENLEWPDVESDLRARAYRSLATYHKRRSEWDQAIQLWAAMQRHHWRAPDVALYPLIELAKVYEHKFRDFRAAREWVERALNLVALRGWQEYRGDLLHRYARVRRRMSTD